MRKSDFYLTAIHASIYSNYSEQKDIKFQESGPGAPLVKFLTLEKDKTGKSVFWGSLREDFSLKWDLSVDWGILKPIVYFLIDKRKLFCG